MELYNALGRPRQGSAALPKKVPVPQKHEGLGKALRSAFLPRAAELPCDIQALLDKLD